MFFFTAFVDVWKSRKNNLKLGFCDHPRCQIHMQDEMADKFACHDNIMYGNKSARPTHISAYLHIAHWARPCIHLDKYNDKTPVC